MKQHTVKLNALLKGRFLTSLIILSLTYLTGCQTKDVKPLSAAEINTYAQPALALSLNNIIMFNTCKTLGSPIVEEATENYKQWLNTNNTIAQAADNFSSRNKTDYVKYNNAFYSLSNIMEVNNIQAAVLDKLNFKQRSPSSQKSICRREFAQVHETTLTSLQPSSTIGNALLAQSSTTLNSDYASLLHTAEEDILSNKPGKSFYSVSNNLALLCENNLTLLTLKNTWPKETYAAYCQNSPLVLVQCDWGTCKQHEPIAYQP